MKWIRLQAESTATRKIHVKVKPLRLEGLRGKIVEGDLWDRGIVLRVKWKGPKSGFVPFYRNSTGKRNYSRQSLLEKGECMVEWDEEFESVCDFLIHSKDKNSFDPWDISFTVLYGKYSTPRNKLEVLGKVSLNIAELASRLESDVERKLPISLKIDGGSILQAALSVRVRFAEVRDSHSQLGIVENLTEGNNKEGILKRLKSLADFNSKSRKGKVDHASSSDSDESSSVVDSDGLALAKSYSTSGSSTHEKSSASDFGSSSKTWSASGLENALVLWKKRRLSLGFSSRKKTEPPLIETNNDKLESNFNESVKCDLLQKSDSCITRNWELKELTSRNGQARLKSSVFFASFDQRDEKAAGESACAAIVAVIADWLHSNQGFMPTLPQFDSLITEGSSHWRELCNDEVYANSFPDKHFDLETVLKAGHRPLTVLHERSFSGVFSPEKFENLKGAMSFDDIWEQIRSKAKDCDGIYIVSWNDHFFVLKVEANAYYIIDSLGERLSEGCNQAYILKFDGTTLMYGKVEKDACSEEMAEAERSKTEQESEEIVCKGKECCKEFIKRFFAAIPLEELEEEEEKKGTVSTFSLLQRLQIDFHCCLSPSAASSSSFQTSTRRMHIL